MMSQSDTSLTELITLSQAASELPPRRAGKKPDVSCLHRWSSHGLRGVRLRYEQVGSTKCTTRQWVRDFFTALKAANEGEHNTAPAPTRSVAARKRAVAAAQAELDNLGVRDRKSNPARTIRRSR